MPAGLDLELTALCRVDDEWWHETYVHDGAFAEGSNGQLIPVLNLKARVRVG